MTYSCIDLTSEYYKAFKGEGGTSLNLNIFFFYYTFFLANLNLCVQSTYIFVKKIKIIFTFV